MVLQPAIDGLFNRLPAHSPEEGKGSFARQTGMEFLARNGKDEATAGADYPAHFAEDRFDFGNVLEDRIRKNDIEGLVRFGNAVSRSTMDGGVDPAPAGNFGVRRIDLEPD